MVPANKYHKKKTQSLQQIYFHREMIFPSTTTLSVQIFSLERFKGWWKYSNWSKAFSNDCDTVSRVKLVQLTGFWDRETFWDHKNSNSLWAAFTVFTNLAIWSKGDSVSFLGTKSPSPLRERYKLHVFHAGTCFVKASGHGCCPLSVAFHFQLKNSFDPIVFASS